MVLKKLNFFALIILLLTSGAAFAADDEKPSGTIVIDEFQVMLLIGGSQGGGTLLLDGHSHNFKVSGLKLGGIGVHKVHLVGDVYNLKNVGDLAGDYVSWQAGLTAGVGKSVIAMKNKKGVKLRLKSSKDEGVALSVGVEGFTISDVH